MPRLAPQTQGVLLIIATMACFSVMDVAAKMLSARVDVIQAVWARYAGQVLVVILILSPRLRSVARTERLGLQMARSACLLFATSFFFTAISRMPIADATAIMLLNPVLITLGAALFLGEGIGARRLAGVLVAFCGALLIIRPGTSAFSLDSLIPLGGAVSYAGYALFTRHLGQRETVWTSLFYTALLGAVALSLVVPFRWQPADGTALALMGVIGLLGTVGQLALIRAFMLAEASTLAPFTYCGILFAVLTGMVIFGEYPDGLTYLGALVIVLAGLYVWHRETRERRARPAKPRP